MDSESSNFYHIEKMFDLLGRKKIRVNLCSIAKKLQFEIMHQHQAHPSGVLATLAYMKRSGNITRHNTPVRIQN
jgi:hypothetical protein